MCSTAGVSERIGGVDVMPVAVPHGPMQVLGYRIGALGYITDAKELPAPALELFRGVRVLVLDALFRHAHPTHLSIDEAVATARRTARQRTFLTHLTHENGHADLVRELPPDVQPAYDGLVITID